MMEPRLGVRIGPGESRISRTIPYSPLTVCPNSLGPTLRPFLKGKKEVWTDKSLYKSRIYLKL